jgi:hypothetical protein
VNIFLTGEQVRLIIYSACYVCIFVAGWSPDGVTNIFNVPNPSSPIMALGSTHPLIEMSSRNLPQVYRAAGA